MENPDCTSEAVSTVFNAHFPLSSLTSASTAAKAVIQLKQRLYDTKCLHYGDFVDRDGVPCSTMAIKDKIRPAHVCHLQIHAAVNMQNVSRAFAASHSFINIAYYLPLPQGFTAPYLDLNPPNNPTSSSSTLHNDQSFSILRQLIPCRPTSTSLPSVLLPILKAVLFQTYQHQLPLNQTKPPKQILIHLHISHIAPNQRLLQKRKRRKARNHEHPWKPLLRFLTHWTNYWTQTMKIQMTALVMKPNLIPILSLLVYSPAKVDQQQSKLMF